MASHRTTNKAESRSESGDIRAKRSRTAAGLASPPHPGSEPQDDLGDGIIWDEELPGFGLRIHRGRPSWIAQGRKDGRTFRRTLGAPPKMDRAVARSAAKILLVAKTESNLSISRETDLLGFGAFMATFLADTRHRWKPRTRSHVELLARNHLIPAFGTKPLTAISRADVVTWFQAKKQSANWALSLLSSAMLHAEQLGLRAQGSNPCAGLRRKKTGFVGQALTPDQYTTLGRALCSTTLPLPIGNLLRFLALTGARRGEGVMLRWDQVHGDRVVLQDSKTGPKTIWLCVPVRALLDSIPKQDDCPTVFHDGNPDAFQQRVWKHWKRLTKDGSLHGLRLHDLRHGYASAALTIGHDLPTIAGLLGHADIATTFMYAHLRTSHLAAAATRVTQRIAGPIAPRPQTKAKAAVSAEKRVARHNRGQDPIRDAVARFYASPEGGQNPILDPHAFCRERGIAFDQFKEALNVFRHQTYRRLVASSSPDVQLGDLT